MDGRLWSANAETNNDPEQFALAREFKEAPDTARSSAVCQRPVDLFSEIMSVERAKAGLHVFTIKLQLSKITTCLSNALKTVTGLWEQESPQRKSAIP